MSQACQSYLPKDFIETRHGLIFAVVQAGSETVDGVRKVLCFLRYIPAETGVGWRKVETSAANTYLAQYHPEYLHHSAILDAAVHAVAIERIYQHYQPRLRLQAILGASKRDAVEEDFAELCQLMQQNGIELSQLGVTGSLLIGRQQASSDIDLLVYDRILFHQIRGIIDKLTHAGKLGELMEQDWQAAYKRRACALSYEEYLRHERRKFNKGLINGRKFDLSFIDGQSSSELTQYRKLGKALIRAKVIEDSQGFDYPAIWRIDHHIVTSIVCFTATYNGQAFNGEIVEVAGLLEQEENGVHRLVVGTSREAPGEYIKVLNP